MSLFFNAIIEKEIKVICRTDSSINFEEMKQGAYDEYLKKLDESHLVLKEGETPTYFHLKTVAKRKDILKRKNSMASMAMKSQKTGETELYTMMYDDIKLALKDITTGGESQMVKGTDGLVSDDIMNWITVSDLLQDLYTALESNSGKTDHDILKKK